MNIELNLIKINLKSKHELNYYIYCYMSMKIVFLYFILQLFSIYNILIYNIYNIYYEIFIIIQNGIKHTRFRNNSVKSIF